MATQVEEAMIVSRGTRHTNTWEDIPTDTKTLEATRLEANMVYEAIYSVPKKPWWQFWMWWKEEFDPVQFTEGLRQKIADETGVTKEEIQVPWWLYNNEVEEPIYAMQVKYVPSPEEEPLAKVAFAWIPVLIFAGIALTGYLATLFFFSPSPKLEELRKLVEEIKELTKEFWEGFEKGVKTVLKYGLPMVIAGGSFYIAGKIISIVGKRK